MVFHRIISYFAAIAATSKEKMDVVPPEKLEFNLMDESLRDADPSPPSSLVTAEAEQHTDKAKTLLDAVKPKHKRKKKKKNMPNSDGS